VALTLLSTLFGVVLGILADFFLREPFMRWLTSLRRHFRSRKLGVKDADNFPLGGHLTDVCLIDGDGIEAIPMKNIVVHYTDEYHVFPKWVREREAEITVAQQTPKNGQPAFWNGDIVHLTRFSSERTANWEDFKLIFSAQKAHYYEFIATASALDAAWASGRLDAHPEFAFLRSITDWRGGSVPADIVNGLPVNLVALTHEGPGKTPMIVFSRRGDVAIAPNVLACAVNENVHPQEDYVHDPRFKGSLSVAHTARRGVREELGWSDDSAAAPNDAAVTEILGFAVHMLTGAYGLLGLVALPISFEHLNRRFSQSAKDRMETKHFVPVPFTIDGVCRFIRDEKVYNLVGVAAVLALAYKNRIPLDTIDRRLMQLDR
jgi:hypothetical protein